MRYMIHACPERIWYVEKFLYPSLRKQGIQAKDIEIWNDTDGKGNLFSCMESFLSCGGIEGGTWHLQDDVLICRDFAKRTKAHDEGIVCGFASEYFERHRPMIPGMVRPLRMWWSFQCIRIPNDIAAECAEWFFAEAVNNRHYASFIEDGKHDDLIFRSFLLREYGNAQVENLTPSLVEHVDWLIGGSVANQDRGARRIQARYWEDRALVDELEKALKNA